MKFSPLDCINYSEHHLMLECGWCGYKAASRSSSQASNEIRVTDPVTGGQKGQKPEQYSLIPVEALAEVARVYGEGAKKYAPHNWRKGYSWSLSYDALQRHINAFWRGESLDPDDGLHHLAHACFHLFLLMTFEKEGLGTDDRA